jgi:hypothetical protein
LKRSATISGAWFGSITPPDPTRMRGVAAAILPDHDFRRGAGDIGEVVMFRDPVALVAQLVGEPCQVERVAQGHGTRRGCGHRR